MLRILMAGLLTAMAAGCGYASDVDLAPMSERIPKRIVSTGDYCEAAIAKPYTVKSSDDCMRLEWNQQARSYTVFEPGDDDPPVVVAIAPLGPDIYLAQVTDPANNPGGRYNVSLVLAKGSALLSLPRLASERLAEVAKRHPGVTLRKSGSDEIIARGSRADIRLFLRATIAEALRGAELDDADIAVVVRDTGGAADHLANAVQSRDISYLLTALRRLQPTD